MSILDNEDVLMESIGKDSLRSGVKQFIRKYMNPKRLPDKYKYFAVTDCLGIVTFKYAVDDVTHLNQLISRADIYKCMLTDDIVIIPKALNVPMGLFSCEKIPDYIKFYFPDDTNEIFQLDCGDSAKLQIELIKKSKKLDSWDEIILKEIYDKFGRYNSEWDEVLDYEKGRKNYYMNKCII